MFNLTLCASAFARDNLLIPRTFHDVEAECGLALPVYYLFLICFTIILLLVAIARTKLVNKRVRKGRRYNSPRGNELAPPSCTRDFIASLSPTLTLVLSWTSFFVLLLFMVIPLAVQPLNNAMIFLVGLQYLAFNSLAELWLLKMVRLGAKIISPTLAKNLSKGSSSSEMTSEPANSGMSSKSLDQKTIKVLEYLGHSDKILQVFHVLIVTGILFQFICLCIVSMVVTDKHMAQVFLRIGIGMQGLNVLLPMCALIWQYERCTMAISATSKGLEGFGISNGRNKALSSVVKKFRTHQAILGVFGSSACVVFLLWGVSAIELSYAVIVVNCLFDALVNCGVLATFIKRETKKVALGTMNSGSLVLGSPTTANDKTVAWVADHTVATQHGDQSQQA